MPEGNISGKIDATAEVVLKALLSNPLGLNKFELERKCQLNRLEVGRACRTLNQRGLATHPCFSIAIC